MKAPQAWRIYHGDAMNKTELTTSPARVAKAKEQGLRVVTMVELDPILKAIQESGHILLKTDSGYKIDTYYEMMGS